MVTRGTVIVMRCIIESCNLFPLMIDFTLFHDMHARNPELLVRFRVERIVFQDFKHGSR